MRRRRIPPMLADIIQAALVSCDGVVFDSLDACPACGGEVAGYDMKKKQFAVLSENGNKKIIYVNVRRFRCRTCNTICLADQPFYVDTRIGSPVVDLCITLGETMHVPSIASTLDGIGIIVDRWSVRNYIRPRRKIPSLEMFGMRVPISIVSISSLAMGSREKTTTDAQALLAACGYPSKSPPPPQHARNDPEDDRVGPGSSQEKSG